MTLQKRHKYVIAGLAMYWPLLFIATHLPIHDLGRQTGMSDKTMHQLAYLGLVFFVWLAVSPYEKVNWRRAKVWVILAVIVWYGVTDEWLQGFVGREARVDDFVADTIGALVGLGILTFVSFWPAALTVTAVFIFVISNLSRIELMVRLPYLNLVFNFAGYAAFTLVWIQYLDRKLPERLSAVKWMVSALSLPLVLLAVVKTSSLFFGKQLWQTDCVAAVLGIVLATVVSRFICKTIWRSDDRPATS